ncbi:ABC-2 family transporter permease [Pseudonocardia phyllosphaerae]|uniref:hypothetical protein n=1 Tax=Pseudonocardia phyllosphaerae TaxID=3390502 RepID=UPI00397E48B4
MTAPDTTAAPGPGPLGVLRSELQRTRRSAALGLSLLGIPLCLLTVLGQAVVTGRRSWASLLQWQTVHVTVVAAVAAALLVAFVERRERRSRGGGTAWRAVGPVPQRAARLGVLAASWLLTNVLVFLPYLFLGPALGYGPAPGERLVAATVLVWAGGLTWLVIAFGLGRLLGPWPVVGIGVAWQVAGTLYAESPSWWWLPPTWSVRPLLPLLGIHQNGVGLEPGSAVWALPAGPPVLASVLVAVLLAPLVVAGDGAAGGRFARRAARLPGGGTGVVARPGSDRVRLPRLRSALALASSLRRTPIGPLLGLVALVLVATAAVYPPSYPAQLWALAVLPAGSAVLAVLAWQAQEPAWRIVLTRAGRAGAPAVRLLGTLGTVVAGCAVLAGALLLADGADPAVTGRQVVVAIAVGWASVAVTLWLHAAVHVAVAWVVAFLGLTAGLLFGGSVLATTPLWLLGPAAWASSGISPDRVVVAVLVPLVTAAVCGTGFVRTTSRG